MRSRLVIAALGGLAIGLGVLVLVQARLLREAREHLSAAFRASGDVPTNSGARPLRLRLQDIPPMPVRTQVQTLDWRSVESDDYASYVANLRKIGCPEETVRDILVADINKLFAARRRTVPLAGEGPSYWLHPDEDPANDPDSAANREREASLQALERERRQLITALLGEGAARAEIAERAEEAMADRDLQFLPDEKRKALAEAQARLRVTLDELDALEDPGLRQTQAAAAERAYDEALAALLSPEEREQLELRTSSLAEGLREKLRGFGATREEFEKLFQLERRFAREREELERAGNSGTDPQWAEKLEAAQLQLQESILQTLGPERVADYERTQDPDYQTLFSLAREHEMSPAVAREVWDMRQTVAEHTERIRGNPLLTPEQKQAALAAVRQETQAAIVEVLGEPLLREYQQQGGAWLEELTSSQGLDEIPPQAAVPEAPPAQTPPLPPLPGIFPTVLPGTLPIQPTPILPVP